MFKGIDHLVIVVDELDRAADDYRKLGFTVVSGGKHPVGSHNALVGFKDGSYLEIIAFYQESPDHRWWEPLKKSERLVDYCMQTDDLERDTHKLRECGVAINDPVPWSRIRPDGYELEWLLSLATGAHRGVAPFLIQDMTSREERIPRQWQHENGAAGIGTLTIAVSELSKVDHWYQTILGKEPLPVADDALEAQGLCFAVGPHQIEFMMPVTPHSPLAEWLRRFGPSPYAATLRGTIREPLLFDQKLLHGADLSFGV
jgi:catechol 2,3-dioxygenase-like lactoylglutathione lyase family enzyme